jgi:hypothetical protein
LYTTAAERIRFSRGQGIFKDVRHVAGMPGLHQKTGKMAAGDRPAVRQLQRPPRRPESALSPAARQSSAALLATRFLLFQQRGHRRVRNINIQPTI